MSEGTVPGLKVSWSEKVDYEAVLDLDQARQAFGLGGTPDAQVSPKARLICDYSPDSLDPVNNEVLHENGEPWRVARQGRVNLALAEVTLTAKPTEAVPQTHYEEAPAGPKSYTGREIEAAWQRATQAIEDGACGSTIDTLLRELGGS
jgi:hypothetical protein